MMAQNNDGLMGNNVDDPPKGISPNNSWADELGTTMGPWGTWSAAPWGKWLCCQPLPTSCSMVYANWLRATSYVHTWGEEKHVVIQNIYCISTPQCLSTPHYVAEVYRSSKHATIKIYIWGQSHGWPNVAAACASGDDTAFEGVDAWVFSIASGQPFAKWTTAPQMIGKTKHQILLPFFLHITWFGG